MGRGPGALAPWAMGQGPWALAQSPITDHAENYFSEMSLFFREIPDFMKTKKNRSVITSRYQPVARLDLCYVSENEGKLFL